ncbi:hypothetical protein [Streptomyces hirsutus]|uniref:hypothetical protein n=1 Tax=Streptomyces hirsutus TaxID=35620 RepID=UPI00369D0D37
MTDQTSPEPPPARSEMEQLRDTAQTLQTIMNRVREAVGTAAPVPVRESYRVRELEVRVSDAEYERNLARQRAERAEAALARVRDECAALTAETEHTHYEADTGIREAVRRVLAALDGTEQPGGVCVHDVPQPALPEPTSEQDRDTLAAALGGDRTASVIAHTLHMYGRTLTDVQIMSDEELLAIPGIGDLSLSTIRARLGGPGRAPLLEKIADEIGRTDLLVWPTARRYEAAAAALAAVDREMPLIRAQAARLEPAIIEQERLAEHVCRLETAIREVLYICGDRGSDVQDILRPALEGSEETKDRWAHRLVHVLADLDRCEHGRHEGDPCGSCGGTSHGNPRIGPDRVIGYGHYGSPIVLPARDHKHEPAAWRQTTTPKDNT